MSGAVAYFFTDFTYLLLLDFFPALGKKCQKRSECTIKFLTSQNWVWFLASMSPSVYTDWKHKN